MRLAPQQVRLIKKTLTRVVGHESRVWQFGSQTDDTMRGGDIDLLLESDAVIASRIKTLCKRDKALVMALGERKMDIPLKDAHTREAPVYAVARRRGILL